VYSEDAIHWHYVQDVVDCSDYENAVDKITDKLALSQAVASLEPMQKQILYLRYVKELSQQHTGRLLGLSQVKVSREEKKILQLLRKAL
jgi:RNA polymerase sporulation-specific sigma factor